MYQFNEKDILAALQNGVAPDDIAKSFTDALNGAVKTARANETKAEKATRMQSILDMALNYVKDFYPDMVTADMEHINAKDLVDIIDQAYNEVQQYSKLFDTIKDVKVHAPKTSIKGTPISQDSIAEFLKMNNLA